MSVSPSGVARPARVCRDCGVLTELEGFSRDRNRPDGRSIYCKPCFAVRYRQHRERKAAAAGRTIGRRRDVPEGQKFCPDCQRMLPLEDFGRNRASRDGYTSYCKPCHNAKGKQTYIRLYGSTREYHLRRRYGIGQADVDRMLVEQDNKCSGCDRPDPEHVDHDHATAQVRGMLCSNCNQALGNVRDSVQVLERLAGYLVKHHFLALGATLTESSVGNGFIELVGKHHAG